MQARITAFVRHNALGLVAILLAATGTAYAASSLPDDSVGTKQLKNGAVTRSKLAAGAVTGSKLGAGAVTSSSLGGGVVSGAKVKKGSLTGSQINASTLGTVPNAKHATTADSATAATTAGSATNASHAADADQLGGKSAAQFAPASKILTSGWKSIGSCGQNCALNVGLLNNDTFDLQAGCQGNSNGNGGAIAFIFTDGSQSRYFEGIAGASTSGGAPYFLLNGTPQGTLTPQVHGFNFDLLSSSGDPLVGTYTAIANYPKVGQCAFNASAISG